MALFLTNTFYGLSYGVLYALIAVSLVVVYRGSRVLNFAQGDIVTVGGFLMFAGSISAGLPILAAAALGTLGTALIGVVFSVVLVPALGRGQRGALRLSGIYDEDAIVNIAIGTLGLSLVIEAVEQMVWGVDPVTVSRLITIPNLNIDGVLVAGSTSEVLGVGILVLAALGLVLSRTTIGRWMVATFDNPVGAKLVGINIRYVYLVSWGISGVLSGVAAILLVPLVYLSPTSLETFLFTAFAAVVIGGFDSLFGIILGGCIFGLLDAYVSAYWSTNWESVLVLLIMVVTLLLRPTGLIRSRRATVVRV